MRGKDYVQGLIEKASKSQIHDAELKGLSDAELRTLVDAIVPGNTAMKAVIYGSMKEKI